MKPKVNDVVKIEFMDHAQNLDTPLKCTVHGKVVRKTKKHYVIRSWECHNEECEHDEYAIMRSAVTKEIVYERPKHPVSLPDNIILGED